MRGTERWLPLLLLLLAALVLGRCNTQICANPALLGSFDSTFEVLDVSLWAVTEGLNHCSVAASCTYQTMANAAVNVTLDPMTAAAPYLTEQTGGAMASRRLMQHSSTRRALAAVQGGTQRSTALSRTRVPSEVSALLTRRLLSGLRGADHLGTNMLSRSSSSLGRGGDLKAATTGSPTNSASDDGIIVVSSSGGNSSGAVAGTISYSGSAVARTPGAGTLPQPLAARSEHMHTAAAQQRRSVHTHTAAVQQRRSVVEQLPDAPDYGPEGLDHDPTIIPFPQPTMPAYGPVASPPSYPAYPACSAYPGAYPPYYPQTPTYRPPSSLPTNSPYLQSPAYPGPCLPQDPASSHPSYPPASAPAHTDDLPRGLRMRLSRDRCIDYPPSCCDVKGSKLKCARWSGFHMATPRCVLYGSLEVTMALLMPPESYSVMYIGLYSGAALDGTNPWQEIDLGWSGFDVVNNTVVYNTRFISDTYDNGLLIPGPELWLGSWTSMLQFRTYRLDWNETDLRWTVDGTLLHALHGRDKVPDLPQSIRVIFRTAFAQGDGPASEVYIRRIKYTAPPR